MSMLGRFNNKERTNAMHKCLRYEIGSKKRLRDVLPELKSVSGGGVNLLQQLPLDLRKHLFDEYVDEVDGVCGICGVLKPFDAPFNITTEPSSWRYSSYHGMAAICPLCEKTRACIEQDPDKDGLLKELLVQIYPLSRIERVVKSLNCIRTLVNQRRTKKNQNPRARVTDRPMLPMIPMPVVKTSIRKRRRAK